MAPLNLVELRTLARLYRHGVEGAKEHLERLARERGDELAELLRFPRANLHAALGDPDLAALVAATIEGSARLKRDALARSRRHSARGLAETLCDVSERRDDGSIALHGPLLSEILLLWGAGCVVFGALGSVDAARLRAILRECRGVVSSAVILTHESLFVFYETARSRGVIRLALQRVVFDADALLVPIELVPAVATPDVPGAVEPMPHPVDTPEPSADTLDGVRPDARRPRPRDPFALRLVEAALTFALGGAP